MVTQLQTQQPNLTVRLVFNDWRAREGVEPKVVDYGIYPWSEAATVRKVLEKYDGGGICSAHAYVAGTSEEIPRADLV